MDRTATSEATVYTPTPIPATLPFLSPVPIPGAIEARTADGRPVWVYATAPTLPEETAVVPTWAKTTALLAITSSVSLVGAAYALEILAGATAALAAALLILAKTAFVLAVLVGLIALVKPRRPGGAQTATATSTATSRGFLGKATATATATIKN